MVSWNNQAGAGAAQVTRDDLYRRRMSGAGDPSRALPRVALVSCRALPLGDEDGPLLQAACVAAGLDTEWLVWDDPAVDWNSYDLAVIRSTWDYSPRKDDFVYWTRTVPRLANPAGVVAWNTDKRYLADLAGARVPIVPTTFIRPGDTYELPTGEYVVKPAVSAGGRDSARYLPEHAELARAHVQRLLDAGRDVMVQPYLPAVDDVGETALVYCGGEFSHAVRKGALLSGPDAEVDGLWRPEEISSSSATAEQQAVAERALAAVPGGPLLYARVDLVPGRDGEPLLLELELTEPSLFLDYADGAADRFAAAIASALGVPSAPASPTR